MSRVYPRCLRTNWKSIRRQSTSIKSLLAEKEVGKDVTFTGWINHKRKLKNATFLDLVDGSTYRPLQVVATSTPETYLPQEVPNCSATVGSSVLIKGILSESRGKQDVELQATNVTVIGESPGEPNVPPDRITFEYSYSQYSLKELIRRITYEHTNTYGPVRLTWLVFSVYDLTLYQRSIIFFQPKNFTIQIHR